MHAEHVEQHLCAPVLRQRPVLWCPASVSSLLCLCCWLWGPSAWAPGLPFMCPLASCRACYDPRGRAASIPLLYMLSILSVFSGTSSREPYLILCLLSLPKCEREVFPGLPQLLTSSL